MAPTIVATDGEKFADADLHREHSGGGGGGLDERGHVGAVADRVETSEVRRQHIRRRVEADDESVGVDALDRDHAGVDQRDVDAGAVARERVQADGGQDPRVGRQDVERRRRHGRRRGRHGRRRGRCTVVVVAARVVTGTVVAGSVVAGSVVAVTGAAVGAGDRRLDDRLDRRGRRRDDRGRHRRGRGRGSVTSGLGGQAAQEDRRREIEGRIIHLRRTVAVSATASVDGLTGSSSPGLGPHSAR
ncbi:MAG: hypothetical protein R2705_22305 [Ilumatobacteraceae bacterium]